MGGDDDDGGGEKPPKGVGRYLGWLISRESHQALGLQSAPDVDSPALAVVFAFLALASTLTVTVWTQYLTWDALVIEQYPLAEGYQANSTCTCSASFITADVVRFNLTNVSYYGLIEATKSPYLFVIEPLIPPGETYAPDTLSLVRAFQTHLSFVNNRIYQVGSFTPDTFVNDTLSMVLNDVSSSVAALVAAAAGTTTLQNNIVTTALQAYLASEFAVLAQNNVTQLLEIYRFIGTRTHTCTHGNAPSSWLVACAWCHAGCPTYTLVR
jgi:hypothetical protein